MGRRKRPSAQRKSKAKSPGQNLSAAQGDRFRPHPLRPNKAFLLAAVLLQTAWIVFLIAMVLKRG